MAKIQVADFKTPYGELTIGSFEDKICLCDWKYRKMRAQVDQRIMQHLNATFEEGETSVIQIAKDQLTEYFEGKRTEFDIPLRLAGTEFQQNVWQALLKVPYGKTDTYLGLSKILGNVKAIRAVAAANGANAISIIVPCHRIIGSQGELVGYAGGLSAKKHLLELENPGKKLQMELFT